MVAPVLIRLPDVSALDGYTQFGMASRQEEALQIYAILKRGSYPSTHMYVVKAAALERMGRFDEQLKNTMMLYIVIILTSLFIVR